MLSIEFKDDTIDKTQDKFSKVYFPNHPIFDYSSSSIKKQIILDAKRETQQQKLNVKNYFYI